MFSDGRIDVFEVFIFSVLKRLFFGIIISFFKFVDEFFGIVGKR